MTRFAARSFITALTITVGAAGMIISANFANAGRAKVLAELRRTGTDLVIVTARQAKNVAGRAKTGAVVTTLRPSDGAAILREIPGVIASSQIVVGSFLLKVGDLSKPARPVVGCDAQYFGMKEWPLAEGRLLDAHDVRMGARVAVLGYTTAQDLFPDQSAIGRRILVNRVPLQVIGVLSRRGQGLDSSNEDDQLYVPVSTAMTRLMNRTYLDLIVLRASSGDALPEIMHRTEVLLGRRHPARPGVTRDFDVLNQQANVETLKASSVRLAFLVRALGVSGSVVSGLGVLALSWMAVRNRTNELGTRRALGASSGHIFLQMFLEGALLSVMAAAAAGAAGYGGTLFAEEKAQLPFGFDVAWSVEIAFTSAGLAQVFGLLAARRAARINPITALRHE